MGSQWREARWRIACDGLRHVLYFLLLSRSHQEWWSAACAAHRTYLLHPVRSRVSLVIRSMLSDFVMLLSDVFGLPRLRFPLTFPWITHFTSSRPPSLIVCPRKESLRRTTNPGSCLAVLRSLRILSSVRCSVQLTRNIRRMSIHIPYIIGYIINSLFGLLKSLTFCINYYCNYLT